MNEKTMQEILGDFHTVVPEGIESLKNGKPITIWLPLPAKVKYDKLQEQSGRQFSKKVREMFLALINMAEMKVA